MTKRFVPVVSATVTVKVKGAIKDTHGVPVPFKFTLTCDRLPASVLKNRIKSGEFDMKETLVEVTTGWQGQRLITDQETNQPAEFCPEALEALLDIAGMAAVCFNAYAAEASANEKN